MSGHRTLLQTSDPEVYSALIGEERRQHDGLELIPSENYTYPEVYCAYGTAFANKYSEGYPGRRYYGGQEFTDQIENLAIDRAKALFRCEHANVQPLSGSPMNQAAYMAFLSPGDNYDEFRQYAADVLSNAQELASRLVAEGCSLVTGGTSNHMMVVDTVENFGLDGREAEELLDAVGMTVNKQIIPDDPRPPLRPSGIRLGTPAATTRGMGRKEMSQLAEWVGQSLRSGGDGRVLDVVRQGVLELCRRFPVPGIP